MMINNGHVILCGAGGHAASVIDALTSSGRKAVFILDDDPAKRGRQIADVVVRGPLSSLTTDELQRYTIVVAIAKNDVRRRIVQDLEGRNAKLSGVRHPSAIISQYAAIHPTAQIMAGVIVNAGAVVEAHSVLNTGCIIEHDVTVAKYAHIGPGAVLAGAVVVEEGVLVATGAKVCPFVRIGGWSTLGAGAVALRDLSAGCLAVGVPARPVRKEAI